MPAVAEEASEADLDASDSSAEDSDGAQAAAKPTSSVADTAVQRPGKSKVKKQTTASFVDAAAGIQPSKKKRRKSEAAGTVADALAPKKKKKKHRKDRVVSSFVAAALPVAGAGAGDDDDFALQQALALSMADSHQGLASEAIIHGGGSCTISPSQHDLREVVASGNVPTAAQPDRDEPRSQAEAQQVKADSAVGSKAKGSGKGRGRQQKVKPPTPEEVQEMFQHISPHSLCLTAGGLQQVKSIVCHCGGV